jgi:hypothetical protein
VSVKGKKKADVVAVTCCDFGSRGRREVITEHYSWAAACRAYAKYWKIYHRKPAERGERPLVRVWIEYVQPEGAKMAAGTDQLKGG